MTADLLRDAIWRASWQATLLFVAVVIFVKLTPRISSAIHCWAYRLICLKLLLALATAPMIEVAILPTSASAAEAELSSDSIKVDAEEWNASRDSDLNQTVAEVVPVNSTSASRSPRSDVAQTATWNSALRISNLSLISWWHAVLVLWVLGVIWQLVRLSVRLQELKQLKMTARNLSETEVGKMLRREAIEMQVPACPSICSLETAECPAVFGHRFPIIVLPRSIIDELSHAELRLLLRHELAHIRRRDLTWNWLATAARTLFFFHPVVTFTLREWRVHQESACDELAIDGQPECTAAYANLLLHVAVSKKPLALTPSAAGIFESFETLKRRIEKIADFGITSQRRQVLAITSVFLLAIVGLTPWKPIATNSVLAVEPLAAAIVQLDKNRKSEGASTKVNGLTIRVVDIKDVSDEKIGYRSDRSQIQMSPTFTSNSTSAQESAGSENMNSKAAGSGFVAGGGAGGGAVVKYDGSPEIGIALQIEGGQGQRFSLVDELIGVSANGKRHKSLPTLGVITRTVPSFEADHRKEVVAYFKNGIKGVKQFTTLKGKLLVEVVETDEVAFRTLRANARQKTKLGEYRITKSQQDGGGIKVAVQTPIPKSLRPALQMNRTNRMSAEAAKKRFDAQRILGVLFFPQCLHLLIGEKTFRCSENFRRADKSGVR